MKLSSHAAIFRDPLLTLLYTVFLLKVLAFYYSSSHLIPNRINLTIIQALIDILNLSFDVAHQVYSAEISILISAKTVAIMQDLRYSSNGLSLKLANI
jgi:hypothetical protein